MGAVASFRREKFEPHSVGLRSITSFSSPTIVLKQKSGSIKQYPGPLRQKSGTMSLKSDTASGLPFRRMSRTASAILTEKPPISEDICTIRASWDIVLDPLLTDAYLTNKMTDGTNKNNNLDWFLDVFTTEISYECADSADLFQLHNSLSSSSLAVELIDFCLDCLDESRRDDIRKLAIRFNKEGIKISHLIMVGTVLHLSLMKVLGSKYDDRTGRAWSKVYSYLISLIARTIQPLEDALSLSNSIE